MLNLPYSPILPLPVTAKQRVLVIPRDQFEKAIEAMEGKTKSRRVVTLQIYTWP